MSSSRVEARVWLAEAVEQLETETLTKAQRTNQLKDKCEDKCVFLGHLRKDGKGSVPNKTTGDAG